MRKLLSSHGSTVLKGIAMGAADVVPGVSGGTIAFITGIYEKLISSINMLNLNTLQLLRKEGLKACWEKINGTFLLSLFAGIFISILSLAKLISYLLKNHTVLLWAFFFGLIVASVIYVGKSVRKWDPVTIVALIAGTIISYWITILPPASQPNAQWYVFLSGMIAICAMILPGISGSFILLLMGSYEMVINAVKELNIVIISIFGIGCITGLLAFSKVLNYMFKKFYNTTIALLTGFLIGSLNKIWPWKETLKHRENSHGEMVPFIQENVSPETYSTLYNTPDQVVWAILLALIGFSLIFILERAALGKNNND